MRQDRNPAGQRAQNANNRHDTSVRRAQQKAPNETNKAVKRLPKKSAVTSKRSGWIKVLRFVLVIVFLLAALIAGAVVGYVVLGKQDMSDVFEWSTWRRVYDLVFAP